MLPDPKFVTIGNNREQISLLLSELVLQPRLNALKWALITKQTPNIKIGYPGQHLASLITGIEGEWTGARGNDLRDGSEVKSCSRIDQLDECAVCASPVARIETQCAKCGSTDILRKNDSKWLFSIRSEAELNILLHEVGRIVLMLGDYPNFDQGDFDTLRFQAFEIWPDSDRHQLFGKLMSNYYQKIYLGHKKKSAAKTPAPKNFWPYSYQFYVCNPILIFSCIVKNAYRNPTIVIDTFVDPKADRAPLPSLVMPPSILDESELDKIFSRATAEELKVRMNTPHLAISKRDWKKLSFQEKAGTFSCIDENLRSYLSLRDTDRIATSKSVYKRRRG